VISDNDFKGSS